MKTFLAGVGLALQFTSAVAAEKMTVAYATLGPALSPGWVTSDKGIWRKHGLDVDLVYLGGGLTLRACAFIREYPAFLWVRHSRLCRRDPRGEDCQARSYDEYARLLPNDFARHSQHR